MERLLTEHCVRISAEVDRIRGEMKIDLGPEFNLKKVMAEICVNVGYSVKR